MNRTLVAFSSKKNYKDAFKDVCEQIDNEGVSPKLIIFTSDVETFWYHAENLKKHYPEATSIGSTSYLKLTNKCCLKKGFCAFVIFSGIECVAGCLFEVDRHPSNYIRHAREAVASLSVCSNTCCLEFTTAFSKGEELVLDTLTEAFKGMDIPIFGGTSGNTEDDEDDKTIVGLNGEIYKNTCVFVLIHNLNGRICLYKENIFKPKNELFIATDVDCENRTVYEYNNKPAAQAMAEALGVNVDKLSSVINNQPITRVIGNEYFNTEVDKVNPDNSISYYSQIYNQTKIALMEQRDIEQVWNETIEKTKSQVSNPSFVIAIDCINRIKLLEKEDKIEQYKDFLTKNYNNFICLSGYGEQLNYMQLNMSFILAIFE